MRERFIIEGNEKEIVCVCVCERERERAMVIVALREGC